MTNTKRKNYKGEAIRDGEHAKKCPSLNCDYCVNGKSKKPAREKERRKVKQSLRKEGMGL